jgi:hypothetical protein
MKRHTHQLLAAQSVAGKSKRKTKAVVVVVGTYKVNSTTLDFAQMLLQKNHELIILNI